MKEDILNGTFSSSNIDSVIDKDLLEMFNPKVEVPTATKDNIKRISQSLTDNFLEITNEYAKPELSSKYTDDVCDAIDRFESAFKQTLNQIPDKLTYAPVGVIWTGIFSKLRSEFKDSPDGMFFQYGLDKLMETLMTKIKK